MTNIMRSLLSAIELYDKGFMIFGIEIAWYAIILTTGMVCALILMVFLAKREQVEAEFCLSTFLFAIIFAIFGARLFYVFGHMEEFSSFWSAFNLRGGGLTIIGGIPCGALGVYISCRLYKKSFFRVCDLVVPCLLLGQVIGRWGNYVNGELYGFEITNDAFKKFPIAVNIDGTWHAANFFYEMMLNLVMLIIMLALTFTIKKKLKVGFLSLLYIIWYGIVRGVLEFVKIGQKMWGNVRAVQLICFICAGIGIIFLILLQLGYIKFETPRMYERHFKIVHEPPPYVEMSASGEVIDNNVQDSSADTRIISTENIEQKTDLEKDNDQEDNNLNEQ